MKEEETRKKEELLVSLQNDRPTDENYGDEDKSIKGMSAGKFEDRWDRAEYITPN